MGVTIEQIPDVLAAEAALDDLLEVHVKAIGRSARMESRWLPGRSDNSLPAARLKATATDVLFGRSSAGAGAGEQVPCTATGRQLIAAANAAAVRALLDLEPGTDVQAQDAFLQAIADAVDLPAVQALMGLEPGVDVQAFDSFLQAIADAANVAAVRTLLGVSIGVDVQAHLASITQRSLTFVIGDGTNEIAAGTVALLRAEFACSIAEATLLSFAADGTAPAGSIVIDVWKDTYANYPPTVADTITASAKPTLSSATKSQDSTLTGWTTTVSAGDILVAYVDSCSSVKQAILNLKVNLA